ncbi:MAG: ribose 1,5-bisphosphate isomerase [Candidatus Altiarchaeota archaeon]|nr:ribose 1,5-bisphosphate isomerase [Candidatus Altiarchaeota archaeon]
MVDTKLVEETAAKIRTMEVRGALKIAVEASKAMLHVIEEGASFEEMVQAADKLKDARPTAVSLPNAVNYILHLAEESSTLEPSVAKATLIANTSNFIEELSSSIDKIAEIGANLIEDGDVLLTICNSKTVTSIMVKAKKDGKNFKVYACETRPRMQGHITVKELTDAGVDVTLIVDSAAYYTMTHKGVKKVFVGADTVYANGDVINKIGTSQVALAAKNAGIEFIVCTESIKLSPGSMIGETVEIEERDPTEVTDLKGVKVFNPAFDITTKEYISKIITEHGVIPPETVYNLLKEKFAWSIGD